MRYQVCFVLVLMSQVTDAASWHVNNRTGTTDGDGSTPATALATIRAAVSRAGAGDTVVLADTGIPYRESVVLSRRGGAPGRPLVIEGGGATVTGLKAISAEQWIAREDGTYFFSTQIRRGSLRPYLVENGVPVPTSARLAELAAGQCCWLAEGVYFRPAGGKTISDHALEGTLLAAGLAIRSGNYITVRNLTAEYFANDGFNVHGSCLGLRFENIVARYNGDDGFSVHEDVGAVVQKGWFHHNDYGIQDVNASRSMYNGIRSEKNRKIGVDLRGGFHSLVDSVVRNNAEGQIQVAANAAAHLGFADDNPLCTGVSYLKNVSASGGPWALRVGANGRASAAQCVFRGAGTGVVVDRTAVCHLVGCIVAYCETREVSTASAAVGFDCNVYFPGRMSWLGESFGPAGWDRYRAASGQDANSLLQDLEMPMEVIFPITDLTLNRGTRRVRVGPTRPVEF